MLLVGAVSLKVRLMPAHWPFKYHCDCHVSCSVFGFTEWNTVSMASDQAVCGAADADRRFQLKYGRLGGKHCRFRKLARVQPEDMRIGGERPAHEVVALRQVTRLEDCATW